MGFRAFNQICFPQLSLFTIAIKNGETRELLCIYLFYFILFHFWRGVGRGGGGGPQKEFHVYDMIKSICFITKINFHIVESCYDKKVQIACFDFVCDQFFTELGNWIF